MIQDFNVLYAVKSFVEIVQYLFTVPGVKCFFEWVAVTRLPREVLWMSTSAGKSSENPNEYKNSQVLCVINSDYGHVPRGNCRGCKNFIDWEAESNLRQNIKRKSPTFT